MTFEVTFRQLNSASNAQSKSMEKLSSGLRINGAADDAAGLAISEKMRAQVRGLDQASANAQDGISLIQTAEGALSETQDILQRMRELAVQSSNDTNTDEDRDSINTEISQLKEEIDRIGNTTEFNTKKLIDGSIGSKKAPGVDNAAVMTEGLGKATSAELTGTVNFNDGTNKIANVTSAIDSATQSITVDGAQIDFKVTQSGLQGTAGDTTGASFASYLQEEINKGIDSYNEKYNATIEHVSITAENNKISIESGSEGANSGVSATVTTTGANNLWEVAGLDVSSAQTLSTSGTDGEFTTAGAANVAAINGTEAATGTATLDSQTVTINAGIANADKANDIVIKFAPSEDQADNGSETATWSGNELTITLNDGTTAGGTHTADELEAIIQGATTGAPEGLDMSEFTLSSTADIDASSITSDTPTTLAGGGNANADTSVVTIDGKEINVTWGETGSTDPSANGSMTDYAQNIQNDINTAIAAYNETVPATEKVENVSVSVKDGAFVVQSGSDKATSSIKFDNSEAAKLLGLAGQSSATQGGGLDFQIGANQTQTMNVTIEDMRTDALGIKDINLSSKEGAQEAITKLDKALEKVSSQRSNLGAYQNRLDHTINNLGTSSENLTAAESRIRDVDMAKEMMEQTKNSILSQASQAMLAQANQLPQGVLQLLR